MKSDDIKCSQMKSNEVNGIKLAWYQITSNKVSRHQMKSNDIQWSKLKSNYYNIKWNQMKSNNIEWNQQTSNTMFVMLIAQMWANDWGDNGHTDWPCLAHGKIQIWNPILENNSKKLETVLVSAPNLIFLHPATLWPCLKIWSINCQIMLRHRVYELFHNKV